MADRYPPGPDHNFAQAILSTIRQQGDRLQFLIELADSYKDICHFHTGPRDIYLLTNPDYIHAALVEQAAKFHKTRPFKRSLGRYLGQGLLVIDGEDHRRERRLAQPAFHHQRIEAYGAVMVAYTHQLIDGWQSGQKYDVSQEMIRLTSRIVAKTLFDADVSQDTEAIARSMAVLQDAAIQQFRLRLPAPAWLPTRQHRIEQDAVRSLDSIVYRIIEERRTSGIDKGDLLSMLFLAHDEDGQRKSINQVRDEVVSLFLAGHETTSNALTWTWYLLSQHPNVVERLQKELAAVLATRPPTIHDVERLTYATMIVKEALRLFPPAWVISREAIADVEIGGYILKAGSVVLASPYITQRDPRYYADADQFQPERFASEQALPRFAYFPFGGGPRVCIGQSFAMMEAVLILATIAQQYDLTLAHDQKIALDPLVTLRPKFGMHMTVTRRP